MTPEDVRQKIRLSMQRFGGRVPTRKFRHRVFFKHKMLTKYGCALSWEDVIRLDRNFDSYWLLCGDSTKTDFDYFVLPHTVGRRLVGDDPLICKTIGKTTRFRNATQNINFDAPRCALTSPNHIEYVSDFKNDAHLFEKWVDPYWHLLDEEDQEDLLTKRCPRCSYDLLPDYGTHKHDFQCRNGKCHLLWCGDYWKGTTRTVQDTLKRRKKSGQPYGPGWWVMDHVSNIWTPLDGLQPPTQGR